MLTRSPDTITVQSGNKTPFAFERVFDESATEATYEVQVTVPAESAGLARDLLVERLEAADYPVGTTEVEERGETTVDVIATLTATTVHSKDLDAVVADLAKRPEVRHATWTVQTGD